MGELEIRYVQEPRDATGAGCFELVVPPGANVPPPHSHVANEELVYVLEGTLRYSVGDETRDLGPGDAMATPCGVAHAFSNPHPNTARALVFNTPDIGSEYFREVGAIVNAGGPPDRSAIVATMLRHGLVPSEAPTSHA